jgi:hypothetical protein
MDGHLLIAVQAIMIWKTGHFLPSQTWHLTGPYAPLLKALQACLITCDDWTPAQRAVMCRDIWSAVGAWPRFKVLGDGVQAFEERVANAR